MNLSITNTIEAKGTVIKVSDLRSLLARIDSATERMNPRAVNDLIVKVNHTPGNQMDGSWTTFSVSIPEVTQ